MDVARNILIEALDTYGGHLSNPEAEVIRLGEILIDLDQVALLILLDESVKGVVDDVAVRI